VTMPRHRFAKAILIGGRLLMAGIFICTGYSKIEPLGGMAWSLSSIRISLAWFAFSVEAYKLLPPWAVAAAAHFLPFFEIALGIWLLTGMALRISSLLSTITIATFFSAILSAYIRKLDIECGCRLLKNEHAGPLALAIDGGLFLLCLALAIISFRDSGIGSATESNIQNVQHKPAPQAGL
jgi:uncharacterized membrane protein YphA (DoxX/SURF4 family)